MIVLLAILLLSMLTLSANQDEVIGSDSVPGILVVGHTAHGSSDARTMQYVPVVQQFTLDEKLTSGDHLQVAVESYNNWLYVSGIREASGDRSFSSAAVFDADSRSLVHEETVPHLFRMAYYIGGIPTIVPSPDGSRAYVQTWKVAGPMVAEHAIRIFDTQQQKLLPQEILLSSGKDAREQCNAAILLPDADEPWLYVLCYRADSVRFIDLATNDTVNEITIPGLSPIGHFGYEMHYINHVAGAVLAQKTRQLYVVTTHGHVFVIDVDEQAIIQEINLALPSGMWTSTFNKIILTPDEKTLYVAVGDRQDSRKQLMKEIWAVDTTTWERFQVLKPQETFTSMTYDPNSNLFFLLRLYDGLLQVVNAEIGREILYQNVTTRGPSQVVVFP